MATLGTVDKVRNLMRVDAAPLAATGDITPYMKANGPFVSFLFGGTWTGTVSILCRPAGNGGTARVCRKFTDVTIAPLGWGVSVDAPSQDVEYAMEFTTRTTGQLDATMYGAAAPSRSAPLKKAAKKGRK